VLNHQAVVLCPNESGVCLCIGKEEGIAGYGRQPCFSPESHTSSPRRFDTYCYIMMLLPLSFFFILLIIFMNTIGIFSVAFIFFVNSYICILSLSTLSERDLSFVGFFSFTFIIINFIFVFHHHQPYLSYQQRWNP